jgi:hypothetical protein
MSFRVTWDNLLDNVEELPADATLLTPLSQKPFHVTDAQQHRVLIEYQADSETVPLQRDQFETLVQRIVDATGEFDLDRLPPGAEPYATVVSLHPRFTIDERDGTLIESETPTHSPLVDATVEHDNDSREEPDIPVYADALLLIDALERYDVTSLTELDVPALVNLYTLLSDVQRNANDLRQEVRALLLDRLHHDQPVSGQYGSVQRTVRRNRTLKNDETILELLEAEGIDPERVMTVDTSKLDDALEVTSLSESDVYDIEESEYVRKADVDEETKESRLQGLKDQLAGADEDTTELQAEVEELEQRITELTSFDSGTSYHTRSTGG